MHGDSIEGDDDPPSNRSTEDPGGLEDTQHKLLGDLALHLSALRRGDDPVVVDLAMCVDGSIDNNGRIAVHENRARRLTGGSRGDKCA